MADIIQLKRGDLARWAEVNPVLFLGEMGFEKDTNRWKIGDGITAWNSLEYAKDIPQHEWDGTSIRFTNPDGSWGDWVDIKGADGLAGTDGADGVGVPEGGTLGQVLAKKSITDFDTEWIDPALQQPSQWEIIETVVATSENVLATVFFDNLPTGDYRIRWNGVGVSGDGVVRWLFYDGTTSRSVNYHCTIFMGSGFSNQYNSNSTTIKWNYDGYTLDNSALGEVYLYNVNTAEFTIKGWGTHRDTTAIREGNQVNTLAMATPGQICNGIKFDPTGGAGFDAGTFILEKRIT